MIQKLRSIFDEKLLKFLLVGILNTLVGNGLGFLLLNCTPMGYWASSAISYVLASIMSYFLNRYFTFKFQEKGIRPALRFALNIAVCYLLAYGLAQPLAEAILSGYSKNVRENVAMLFGMGLFTILNYLGQRFFAFRERKNPLREDEHQGNVALVCSFAVPVIVMFVALACHRVFPFGDQQVLAHDMWHQYYPFFRDFRRTLLEGGSLLYSKTSGLGASFAPLYAYYLASPFNFLSALVPEAWLLEFYTLLVLLKIGLAGLSFALFLRITFGRKDATVAPFAISFALCSFLMGYYWNPMWLDTVALLPMVTAGAIALLRHGHWRLYVVSLALALWCNYYIAFFVCIFQIFVFLGYTFCYWDGFKGFFQRLGRMAAYSLLGIGMTAALMIPAYLGLQNTYSAINQFPKGLSLNIAKEKTWLGILDAFRQIFANQMIGTVPTTMSGLPNIYCGVGSVFLAAMYCVNGRFRLRERISAIVLLLFFAASFIFRQLDYIWHGFHFTNMLPYRFSFLYSFVVLTMAYRVFIRWEKCKVWHGIVGLLAVVGVSVCGFLGDGDLWMPIVTLVIGVLMLVLFLLTRFHKTSQAVAFLLVVCVAEGAVCAAFGVNKAGTSTRSTYPKAQKGVSGVLEKIEQAESERTDFCRTEVSNYQCLNDPALLGYDGVTVFSSTSLKNVSDFTLHMGLSSWPSSNRYAYVQSSPFTNLLLNIKYIIDREGNYLDPLYTDAFAESDGVKAYAVNSYLPMGFVMKDDILTYDVKGGRAFPMTVQNKLFRLATGISEPLYSPIYADLMECGGTSSKPTPDATNVYYYHTEDMTEDPTLKFTYHIKNDTLLCLYFQSKDIDNLNIYANGDYLCSRNVKVGSLMCLGYYHAGDKVSISCKAKAGRAGKVNLQACGFNVMTFDAGRKLLARSTLEASEVTDTTLQGSIRVAEKGVFYTSIPYELGWAASVDGAPVEITPVGGAFIAFPIEAGQHTISLEYHQPYGRVAVCISIGCLLIFVGMFLKSLLRKPELATEAQMEEQMEPAVDLPPIEELLEAMEDTDKEQPPEDFPENMPPLDLSKPENRE